jgi:hypothetical protein
MNDRLKKLSNIWQGKYSKHTEWKRKDFLLGLISDHPPSHLSNYLMYYLSDVGESAVVFLIDQTSQTLFP